MKTQRIISLVIALFVLSLLQLRADEPPQPRRVLILRNETTLAGAIEQAEATYRITNDTGETIIAASQVLKLCESVEAAYEYLRQRANLRDPDERLRLARWCQRNGLPGPAREEAKEALRLRPRYPDAERLLKTIVHDEQTPGTTPTQPAEAKNATAVEAGTPALSKGRDSPGAGVSKSQGHDCSPEILKSFAQRIQPVVLNGCGTVACHGGKSGTGFDLQRPAADAPVQSALTRHNLSQTLGLIDKDDPPGSALLRKALEAHGGGSQPPLRGRDVMAYKTLEAWVFKVAPRKSADLSPLNPGEASPPAPNSNAMTEKEPIVSTPRPVQTLTPDDKEPVQVSVPQRRVEEPAGAKAAGTIPSLPMPTTAPAAGVPQQNAKAPAGPKPPPKPVDPFDPAVFNHRFHPMRPSSGDH